MAKKRGNKKKINLIFIIGLIILAILLLEGGLRITEHFFPGAIITYPYILTPSTNPSLVYSTKPNLQNYVFMGSKINTNSEGFRDNEFSDKPNEDLMIISLGDSLAFGLGADNEDTYAAQIEKFSKEHESNNSINVINLAVPGYSLKQSKILFDQYVERYNPGLVIVTFSLEETDFETKDLSKKNNIFDNSYIYNLLFGAKFSEKREIYLKQFKKKDDYLKHIKKKLDSPELLQDLEILDEMKNKMESQDKRLLVMIIPTPKREFILDPEVISVYNELYKKLEQRDHTPQEFIPWVKTELENLNSSELTQKELNNLITNILIRRLISMQLINP